MMRIVCPHCHEGMPVTVLGEASVKYVAAFGAFDEVTCCSAKCAEDYGRAHHAAARQEAATLIGMGHPVTFGEVVPYKAPDPIPQQIRDLQETLRRKNRALDALHYVWCTGACEKGVHRFGEHPPLTDELVAEAEHQARRLRVRLENEKFAAERAP